MEKIIVNGGRALRGTVRISGGKNSSLAIITAACLAAEMPDIPKVEQRRPFGIRHQGDRSPPAAIAAVWSATRHKLFPAKR